MAAVAQSRPITLKLSNRRSQFSPSLSTIAVVVLPKPLSLLTLHMNAQSTFISLAHTGCIAKFKMRAQHKNNNCSSALSLNLQIAERKEKRRQKQ